MSESRRKVTFKLYPSKTQEALLLDMKGLHQRLYNAALEQRIDAYKRCGVSLPFSKQCKELTTLRRVDPVYSSLNAQSCQVTLKRLELAFQSFFRRLKAGIKAGFPRFKSFRRFTGWGYKAHGDGFRVFSEGHHGTIRLSGIGTLKMRGKARQWGEVKTCEILHKQGDWYATIPHLREQASCTASRIDHELAVPDRIPFLGARSDRIRVTRRPSRHTNARAVTSPGLPCSRWLAEFTPPTTTCMEDLSTSATFDRELRGWPAG